MSPTAASTHGGVFHTSGHAAHAIHRHRFCVIEGILLDTGAGLNVVTRDLVTKLGLSPYEVEGLTTVGSGGHESEYTSMVSFPLWLGGIQKTISAYVSDKDEGEDLSIGQPGRAIFNVVDSTCDTGMNVHSRVTVAKVQGGERFVLTEDASDASPCLTMETFTQEMIEDLDRGVSVGTKHESGVVDAPKDGADDEKAMTDGKAEGGGKSNDEHSATENKSTGETHTAEDHTKRADTPTQDVSKVSLPAMPSWLYPEL